ncbi:MAG: M48 family metallopeptidase [Bdellovibrionales bacterium]
MMTITGKLYKKSSLQFEAVVCHFSNDRLSFKLNGQDISFKINNLVIEKPLGSLPREIKLPNEDMISLAHSKELSNILDQGKNNFVDNIERNKVLVLITVLVIPLFFYINFYFLIPIVAEKTARLLPPEIASDLSQKNFEQLDDAFMSESILPEPMRVRFRANWEKKIRKIGLEPQKYTIFFRNSQKLGANAFALPDGKILITDQFIEATDFNSEKVFTVLLHEVGHVEELHTLRSLAQTLGTSLLIGFIMGDLSNISDLIVGAGVQILHAQYSQDFEWEADNFALEKLELLGIDSHIYAETLSDLKRATQDKGQPSSFFSTHPKIQERIDSARKRSNQ